jgi:ElaB/YqjD/DUF883 family membrane-anchored ribosome-binding protein
MENNSTNSTREALVNDISNLKRDVTQVAQDVKDHAGAHVEATKQRINDKVQAVRDAAAARPLLVLGIGFLIGFILGVRRR